MLHKKGGTVESARMSAGKECAAHHQQEAEIRSIRCARHTREMRKNS